VTSRRHILELKTPANASAAQRSWQLFSLESEPRINQSRQRTKTAVLS
jgi:hypothetical protein